MAAAHDTSVSARVAYQETDFITTSKGDRTLALLESNISSAVQEFTYKKNLKKNQAGKKSQSNDSSPDDASFDLIKS